MKRVALTVALMSAAPAWTQPVADIGALLEAARQAQDAGKPSQAVELLQRAAAARPGDADILRRLGVAQGQTGRASEALATLDRAARLAPQDRDIALARARIFYYRGEHRRALRIAEAVLVEQPSNEDARNLAGSARRALADPDRETRWRLDWTASYSDFDDDARERWLESSWAVGYRTDALTAITARLDIADRFGRTDVHGEVRADRRVGEGVSIYGGLGITPEADFLPQWAAIAGTEARAWRSAAGDGVLTLDGRYAEYRSGSVESLSPGLQYYLPGGQAWLTGKLIVTWDENGKRQTGYLVRGDTQVTEQARFFAGYADAPETVENRTLSTRTWFVGGAVDVSNRVVLRADYAHDDRERSYVRHAFTVGLGLRF